MTQMTYLCTDKDITVEQVIAFLKQFPMDYIVCSAEAPTGANNIYVKSPKVDHDN